MHMFYPSTQSVDIYINMCSCIFESTLHPALACSQISSTLAFIHLCLCRQHDCHSSTPFPSGSYPLRVYSSPSKQNQTNTHTATNMFKKNTCGMPFLTPYVPHFFATRHTPHTPNTACNTSPRPTPRARAERPPRSNDALSELPGARTSGARGVVDGFQPDWAESMGHDPNQKHRHGRYTHLTTLGLQVAGRMVDEWADVTKLGPVKGGKQVAWFW